MPWPLKNHTVVACMENPECSAKLIGDWNEYEWTWMWGRSDINKYRNKRKLWNLGHHFKLSSLYELQKSQWSPVSDQPLLTELANIKWQCHKTVHKMGSNLSLLHMTNLQCMLSCCNLRCFDEISILLHFTHFCVEQKFTQKSCLWSKNDKYHVWQWWWRCCLFRPFSSLYPTLSSSSTFFVGLDVWRVFPGLGLNT